MMPPSHTRPAWLPLRLIALGAIAACAVLAWHHVPASEWLRFLAGKDVVSADGTTLLHAMRDRAGTTLLILISALLLAFTSGLALSFVATRIGFGLPSLFSLMGRLLAALPVVAIAWSAIGFIVGRQGWPIESLLPHHPAQDRDTWALTTGRQLWWWLVPSWILALPLMGDFMARTIEHLRELSHSPLLPALKARGLKRSAIHYRHTLPVAWPELLDHIEALGLLALGYLVFVKDALGIPGWGTFLAGAIESGDARGIAAAIYAAGWLAGAWCLLISVLWRMPVRHSWKARQIRSHHHPSTDLSATTVLSLLLLVLTCCSFVGSTTSDWSSMLATCVSPLVHDLSAAAAGCALALAITITLGTACGSMRHLRFLLGVAETIAWSPTLVWALGLASLAKDASWLVLGLVVAPGGVTLVARRCRELLASGFMQASLSMGTGRLRAWRMHILPEMFRLVLAWTLETMAMLLIWLMLIDSLRPPGREGITSLGQAIGAAKEGVLSDLSPLLVPALIVAICALFFRQLSLIVRPGPPPH